jgi:hypothetical protein
MKIKNLHLAANLPRGFTLPACVFIALAISACGGTPKTSRTRNVSTAPTVSLTLMPNSEQRLESGKTLPICATLMNDPERKGVTWTLTGGGKLVAQTATSVMYQAPSIISAQESITVTATALAGGRGTTSLTIMLVPQKTAEAEHKDHPDQTGEGARR